MTARELSRLATPLNELAAEIVEINLANGWNVLTPADWEEPYRLPTCIALIHSEASEALEGFRRGDRANVAEELADVLIRVLDTAGGLGIDMDAEVRSKLRRNRGARIPARGQGRMKTLGQSQGPTDRLSRWGWAQLPPAGGSTSTMTAEAAARVIVEAGIGGEPPDDDIAVVLQWVDRFHVAYRRAAKRTHPDAGGSAREFQLVQEARRVLEAHHGGDR